MKKIVFLLSAFLLTTAACFSQTIEGDRLLDLVGKSVSDPLFQQLKTQETFYTDAWDEDFTIYIVRTGNTITAVELQNGKLRYNGTDRYGYYQRKLPMNLNWNMTAADLDKQFGAAKIVSTSMGFSDYNSGEWRITVYFEKEKMVSVSFSKPAELQTRATVQPVISTPPNKSLPAPTSTGWTINFDPVNATAKLNWPALKDLIIANEKLKPYTSSDSVDYIGQVYYGTPYKAIGFERTAIKRKKANGVWYYEAFYKANVKLADTEKIRDLFFALYDEMKKTIKDNSGEDFILVSSAQKPLSATTMNWLAQWSLYSNYKLLPPGLKTIRIALMLTGMDNSFKPGTRDYTFKFYVCSDKVDYDFWTWDTPR